MTHWALLRWDYLQCYTRRRPVLRWCRHRGPTCRSGLVESDPWIWPARPRLNGRALLVSATLSTASRVDSGGGTDP